MASKRRQKAGGSKAQETAQTIVRRSGQVAEDKAQRRAVTQAITDGINEYKLQQKAKQREQDKKLKKAQAEVEKLKQEYQEKLQALENAPAASAGKKQPLPWILLGVSWMLFISVAVAVSL